MDGQDFLRRMQAGDRKVWDELIPMLRATTLGACRDLKVFDTLKEDIVQDVAFKVFTDWQAYRGDSKLSTWIYAIARNRCLDELRKRRVRGDDRPPPGAGGDDDGPAAPEPSYHPDPDQTLCVQQVIAELEAQGEARKGSMRVVDVLMWCVTHSPTTEELATFLKTSVAAAKERKSYILRKVRELCRKHCGEDDCSMARAA